MSAPALRPPVFIIGNPRSGTTLLRLMLNAHPHIAVPPECGFAIWWKDRYHDWSANDAGTPRLATFLQDLASSRKIGGWNLPWDDLKAELEHRAPPSYAALASAVYEFHGRTHHPQLHRWGDKNNFHVRHIADLRELFPEALFLHIVRDGRDVACSYRQVHAAASSHQHAPKLPQDLQAIATEWGDNLTQVTTAFNAFEWAGASEVRYEDLVTAPEVTLRDICQFLGEDFDEAMLNYHHRSSEEGAEPPAFLAWKALTVQPPQTSQVGRYLADLSAADTHLFNKQAGAPLRRYGYL